MYTDEHCGSQVRLLKQSTPFRNSLPVTRKDDRFPSIRWNVHGDLPSPVIVERLGHKLSRDCIDGLRRRFFGFTWIGHDAIVCISVHGPSHSYLTLRSRRLPSCAGWQPGRRWRNGIYAEVRGRCRYKELPHAKGSPHALSSRMKSEVLLMR